MSAPLRKLPTQEPAEIVERRIRALLMEGRILDARDVLEAADPSLPIDPKLRELLAPARVWTSDVRDVDRSREYHWLRTQSGRYRGQWVALVGPDLVASAPSLQELRARLAALPPAGSPLIHRID
jgi:hypothetical protein